MPRTPTSALALVTALALPLGACSLARNTDPEVSAPPTILDDVEGGTATNGGPGDDEQTGEVAARPSDPGTVVLVTHDSFNLPEELVAQFEAETGYDLEVQLSGDAGELTNQLVLTAGRPVADAVFGIDTTFASRAVREQVLAAYTPGALPAAAEEHALDAGEAAYLTPVDYGDVCVNVDNVWFANNGIAPPETLLDLTDPFIVGLAPLVMVGLLMALTESALLGVGQVMSWMFWLGSAAMCATAPVHRAESVLSPPLTEDDSRRRTPHSYRTGMEAASVGHGRQPGVRRSRAVERLS